MSEETRQTPQVRHASALIGRDPDDAILAAVAAGRSLASQRVAEPTTPQDNPDDVEEFIYKLGRKVPLRVTNRWTPYQLIDSLFVVISAIPTCWLAWVLLREGFHISLARMVYLVVFWIVLTYMALPRLHQILSILYVPDYYIGRSRTADGILGDPINLAFLGEEEDIHLAMRAAGWTMADDITLSSAAKIVFASVFRRSYPSAPVSPLYLFGHSQAFSYQQEVDGDPSQRHHIRFWPAPEDWVLPGGYRVDWLAAATFDRAVGLSLFTFQVTHKIDENIDLERDHVVRSIRRSCPITSVAVIADAQTAYHSRNGGGDRVITDGHMPVLDVNAMNEEGLIYFEDSAWDHDKVMRSSREKANEAREAGKSRVRDHHLPPPAMIGASVLVGLHMLELALAGFLLTTQTSVDTGAPLTIYDSRAAGIGFLVVTAIMGLCLVGTLLRRKWLRLMLLLVMTATAIVRLIETVQTQAVHTSLWLISATLAVLAILALTSPSVRGWVRAQ
ncbi:LssY C-terminal domain-containing protein [Nanchangia anserum]|uniref:LssY C-terminal domain-containing protein n=1 Tax=Nanchangia anserum TaxID=2692125 RepID=A0A8I0KQ04_9ACTO|nr:LssY C-terminal domain-containing protein [Nanchangia anserum]MBD3689450.1 LssY C-terminal domain-containing protein [Nanchangia anserum]QOX81650.1 LssY C-terminal domain-containing protein [Nanchangia anserum]